MAAGPSPGAAAGSAGAAAQHRSRSRSAGRSVSPAERAERRSTTGSFRSLRVRNYRLFAGGQLVSLTGTWMQMTAQDWLVLQLGGGGIGLGGVLALQVLPAPLFGVYRGGVGGPGGTDDIVPFHPTPFRGGA